MLSFISPLSYWSGGVGGGAVVPAFSSASGFSSASFAPTAFSFPVIVGGAFDSDAFDIVSFDENAFSLDGALITGPVGPRLRGFQHGRMLTFINSGLIF
jgi:hypothetical protein